MDPSRVNGLRLDWISSFAAVARHGGFSAAAKVVFRSQPRVSTHVSELEHALGTTLFDRTVSPVALTPEGRALLPHAEAILARLELFAAPTTGGVQAEVRLGAYPSAAAFLYPATVRRLEHLHPRLTLVLREGPSVALGGLLCGGHVDLAIRPVLPLIAEDGLTSRVLWEEPLVAVVACSSALSSRDEMSLAALAGLPLVTIGDSSSRTARQFETNLAFAQAGLTPEIAFQTDQPQTLISLVRSGLGIGLTNALAMTTANLDGVALLPVRDTAVSRQVAVWWRTDAPDSAATAAVRAVLAELPVPRWPWRSTPA